MSNCSHDVIGTVRIQRISQYERRLMECVKCHRVFWTYSEEGKEAK